jgi:hypothetical protein
VNITGALVLIKEVEALLTKIYRCKQQGSGRRFSYQPHGPRTKTFIQAEINMSVNIARPIIKTAATFRSFEYERGMRCCDEDI